MRTHPPAFLISALVHLGLLALLLTGIAQLPSDELEETRLAVTLEMFQPPPPPPEPEPIVAPEPEPEPEVVKPPPPKPEPKPKPKPKAKPKKRPTPEPPAEVKPVTPPLPTPIVEPKPVQVMPVIPRVDPGLIRRIEDEYKASLRQAIERHKTYPRRAVRLRKQGEVVMGFTVLKDGNIKDIRVLESSGVSLLDTAARSAVERTSGSLPLPEALERQEWAFTIPINFTLR